MNQPLEIGRAGNSSVLKPCGCCQGAHVRTPAEIRNPPGMKVVAYRIGDYSKFQDSMLVDLSDQDHQALQNYTSRDPDSFSIALLSGWAAIADILTFYQERIANESYLRTAKEPESLAQMARLVGYRARPGVAASTYLAFTVNDAPGSPPQTTIDAGTKVQSIPGPEEKPQVFETTERIEANVEWNQMRPCSSRPQRFLIEPDKPGGELKLKYEQTRSEVGSLYLQGVNLSIKAGDYLLIEQAERLRVTKQVVAVSIDSGAKLTQVDFAPSPQLPSYQEPRVSATPLEAARVFALRQRVALFGYNAPKIHGFWRNLWSGWPPAGREWRLQDKQTDTLLLDNAYTGIAPGSYIVIQKPGGSPKILRVTSTAVHPHTAYGLSANTTRLTFEGDSPWWQGVLTQEPKSLGELRDIAVYVQSEPLTLALMPLKDRLKAGQVCIALEKTYSGVRSGLRIVLTGELSVSKKTSGSEVLVVKEAKTENGGTVLILGEPLQNSYILDTVRLNANVVRATQGETVSEILGSGDPRQAFQRFDLQQGPLTHTSAPTPEGVESSLKVYVDDVQWHERPNLLDRGPHERLFTSRLDNDGKTSIEFGDGQTGAPLPAGSENVSVKYRRGLGREGSVKAGQLTELMTCPMGVKAVTNPISASGGEDRESLAELRRNLTSSLLTLGRLVSRKDYEDYARTFPGIAKAKLASEDAKQRFRVRITVAGPCGAPVEPQSNTYQQLQRALRELGDPRVIVKLQSYRKVPFQIAAKISVDSDYILEKVLAQVRQRLGESFSFDSRDLGQKVPKSELFAVIQNVPGVVSVSITKPDQNELTIESKDAEAAGLLTLDETSLPQVEVAR